MADRDIPPVDESPALVNATEGEVSVSQRQGPLPLTRRELLVAAAAVTVAACAPADQSQAHGPEAPATPFSLGRPAAFYADGTVPRALAQSAAQRLAGAGGIPSASVASGVSNADLVLTYGTLPQGYTSVLVGASAYAAVTHLRVPVENASVEALHSLLAGATTDWSGAGAPYQLGVRVVALDTLPLPKGFALAPSATRVSTIEALLAAVRAQAGAVALVPAEVADWSVRNLGIDGAFPIQGRVLSPTDANALPPLTLRLGVRRDLAKRGLDGTTLAAAIKPLLATESPMVDMLVVGDIMLGRGVNNKMVAYGDYLYPFRGIHDEFHNADLRVANLECTVTDLYPIPTDPYTFTFVTAKRAIEGLAYSGLSAVTVANNHANGPGAPAFLDMLNTLRDRGIATCGGGHTLSEARAPAIIEAKGRRVAILGYDMIPPQGPYATATSPGLAPVDLATLPGDIAAARGQADLVIPYFHWGIEYTKVPTFEQQRTARAAIDAGADMVLGNHPHWVQGIESYKGKLIIYSFGNCVFDQDWSRPTREGVIIHFYWRGATLAGIRIVPVLDEDRCQPHILSAAESVDIFERMWSGTDALAAGRYGPEPEP